MSNYPSKRGNEKTGQEKKNKEQIILLHFCSQKVKRNRKEEGKSKPPKEDISLKEEV